VNDGDSIVENEAFTFPLAIDLGDFCKVFEDAALEVVDVFKALVEKV
jgi:hypothetical protein